MADRGHPGVDAYIQALPMWQQQLCRDLRELIWQADPEIEETAKRSVQPYFALEGNVCALLATKDHKSRSLRTVGWSARQHGREVNRTRPRGPGSAWPPRVR